MQRRHIIYRPGAVLDGAVIKYVLGTVVSLLIFIAQDKGLDAPGVYIVYSV